ncbi:(2Fe-2S)-binding protein [Sphingomonas bacterium]|uniref:(2Fe-2S)-binding protein n=1 Tax=Sphingomonas bacterium TaxID=1895847 RepID=UPI0015754FE3|nr:(2Fe-2S)-binding protein [Sphingomonas bacterium]
MTRFTVNGNAVHYKMDPATPLLWALRDASNLTGTKYGCGLGQCGACTVHVDGVAHRSCQVTIGAIEGSFVTTIEGLSPDRGHPVQQAWVAEQVPQCGYCQSGMIMAAAALLAHTPHPTDGEVDRAITNLCRCGTYPRIRRAIQRAAEVIAGGDPITAAPPPEIKPADAAAAVPALTPSTKR